MTRLLHILIWIAFAGNSLAANADRLLAEGNRAYAAGEFDAALSKYKEASDALPESSVAAFNRGAALYRKEQFAEAASAFREAAILSNDPAFRAKAQFNLGNSAFQQTVKGDPEAVQDACRRSIESYLEALKLNPGYREAAENLELARLRLSALEELQQKEKEEEKKQEEENPLVKKLKELIQRQSSAIGENEALSPRLQDGQAASIRALAGTQGKLQEETAALLEEMAKVQEAVKIKGTQPDDESQAKLELAMKHTGNSINQQANALQALDDGTLDPAQASQNGSLTELKEALKALSDPPKPQDQKQESKDQQDQSEQKSGDQNQEQKHQEKEEGEQSQDQKEKQEDSQEKKQPESSQDKKEESKEENAEEKEPSPNEKALESLNQTAEDILNEEKANLERRGPFRLRQFRVEKDW